MNFFGPVQKVNSDGKSWYSSLLLNMNLFATEKFRIYRTESFPHENFESCGTKQFRTKIVIPAHPLLSVTFFHTRKYWNINWSPYEIFRHCETKKFRQEVLLFSTLSHPYTFSLPKIFGNTAQKGSPTKFFTPARQNKFEGKSWFPPTFSYL